MKPIFTNKERVKMKQRLTKKINMPVWVILVFIATAMVALGVLASSAIKSERESAVNNYKESEYLKTASLSDVQELTVKTVWYRASQLSGFVILLVAVGVAIGLSHGIALIRVSK